MWSVLFSSLLLLAPAEPDVLAEARAALRDGRADDARRSLERAVREHPDWVDARLYLGLAHSELKHWRQAL